MTYGTISLLSYFPILPRKVPKGCLSFVPSRPIRHTHIRRRDGNAFDLHNKSRKIMAAGSLLAGVEIGAKDNDRQTKLCHPHTASLRTA